jgi:hypothetical protein
LAFDLGAEGPSARDQLQSRFATVYKSH